LSELFEPSVYTPRSRYVRDPWWWEYPHLKPYTPISSAYRPPAKSYLRDSYLSPVKRTYLWGHHPVRPFSEYTPRCCLQPITDNTFRGRNEKLSLAIDRRNGPLPVLERRSQKRRAGRVYALSPKTGPKVSKTSRRTVDRSRFFRPPHDFPTPAICADNRNSRV